MTLAAELHAVRAGYGLAEALHVVDVRCPPGRVTVLLGRNGSGRSTVLDVLAGATRPTAGRVRLQGRDVTALPAHRRAALGIALVPARRAVFGPLTVAETLGLSGPPARVTADFPELSGLLGRRCDALSGGQQQLVALGRALLADPAVLLLDEPERGLAPSVAERLHGLLLASGRTVVVTARKVPAWAGAGAVVHVLERGRVVWVGEAGELRQAAAS